MKLQLACKNLIITTALLVGFPISSGAATLPNPYPAFVNDDNGASVFPVPDQALSVNLSNSLNADFGFYYVNTGHMVTVFNGTDPALLSIDPTLGTFAAIDFSTGPGTGHIHVSFNISGIPLSRDTDFATESGDIGFFLTKAGVGTIFSEASLNPGARDLVGVYTSKVTLPTDFVIGFYAPPFLPSNPLLSGTLLASQGFRPIADVSPVPEPQSYVMILAGLGLMGWVVSRRRTKDSRIS